MKNSKIFGPCLCLLLLAISVAASNLLTEAKPADTKIAACEPLHTYPRSKSELAFGEREFRQMLKDRPDMATFVTEGDVIWRHAVRFYAGELIGEPIRWDKTERLNLPIHYYAAHSWSGKHCEIELRSTDNEGKKLRGDYLWAGLFYEFFNSAFRPERLAITKEALNGSITKSEYIRRFTKIEYLAARELANFSTTVWLPRMRTLNKPSVYWTSHKPTSYEDWLMEAKGAYKGYPEEVFGKQFDNLVNERSHTIPNND